MPLTNRQYQALISEYKNRLATETLERDQRVRVIYDAVPALTDLDDKLSEIRSSLFAKIIDGDNDALSTVSKAMEEHSIAKSKLIRSAGFDPSDMDIHYTCPDCKDTGYIAGNEKCHCFKQSIIKLIFSHSNLNERVLKEECFDNFNFVFYSDEHKDSQTGETDLSQAKLAYDTSIQFCDKFGQNFSNIVFCGQPGVGKTFLSNCIAGRLLSEGHTVIYMGAHTLFDQLSKMTFDKDEDSARDYSDIEQCDLLIIDDLGTELTNKFTVNSLFQIVDTRIQLQKSTIISTNLSPIQIFDTYHERIFSRIKSNYTFLKLSGDDNRQKRRN